MNTILHTEQFSATNRINELGLDVGDLQETVRAAFIARSACTDLDPPYYAGMTMHAVAVRQLRLQLIPKRWKPSDLGNYSRVISPDGSIAIGVATGDEFTGVASESPATRSPKGTRTIEALAANAHQLGFEILLPEGFALPEIKESDCTTWLLLMRVVGGQVQSELSHPFNIDDGRRVSEWRERIVLPRVDFDPTDRLPLETDEGVDFDVPVTRRA